jgi:TldD protein
MMKYGDEENSRGVCATVFANGAYGFMALPRYNDAAVQYVLKKAKENALQLAALQKNPLPPVPETENGSIMRDMDYRFLTQHQVCKFATELGKYAESKKPGVKVEISVLQDATEKLLIVSNGYDYHNIESLPGISVRLKMDDVSVYKEIHPRRRTMCSITEDPSEVYAMIDTLFEELAEKKAEEKDMVFAEGGEWDCVLSPEFVSLLAHEAVGHTMEADAVLQKGSVGLEFMGKQVASPLVSLTDFHSKVCGGVDGLLDIPVDDEGVKCIDAPLIKDGILCGALTDRRTAAALGMPMTGNARASQYCDTTIIRMRNTCFHPGTSKFEDMIAAIDKGYYLKKMGGGNGSLKGEFRMTAMELYEIRGGQLGRKVKPTSVAGIAWDALKTVDMVGAEFSGGEMCGTCGKDDQGIHTAEGGAAFKMRLKIAGR